jgi:uncharacterized protein (TIGR03546 family)
VITLLAKLLKALSSDDNPAQISLAVVLAAFLGLTPLLSPHNILVVFLVLIVRVNLSMFILSFGVFTLLAFLVDPLSHIMGLAILHSDALSPVWNEFYQSSFWRFIAYNNTLVMGSVSLCLILSVPLFIGSRWFVVNYREHVLQWVNKSRLMVWLKSSRLYTTYIALDN